MTTETIYAVIHTKLPLNIYAFAQSPQNHLHPPPYLISVNVIVILPS